jgi:hypothetical protein
MCSLDADKAPSRLVRAAVGEAFSRLGHVRGGLVRQRRWWPAGRSCLRILISRAGESNHGPDQSNRAGCRRSRGCGCGCGAGAAGSDAGAGGADALVVARRLSSAPGPSPPSGDTHDKHTHKANGEVSVNANRRPAAQAGWEGEGRLAGSLSLGVK